MEEEEKKQEGFLKSVDLKKTIKAITIVIGFALIVFMSFFSAKFDFGKMDWGEWGANSSILVGIMIFGILMGSSVGEDFQKEKKGGRFQTSCASYKTADTLIEPIKVYFSQFWLWFKEKQLKEKKVEYLIDRQFDRRVALAIIHNIEKEDLCVGALGYDESKPHEKYFIKNGKPIKKLDNEALKAVKEAFNLRLDTFGESYYLTMLDEGLGKIKEAEVGKAIQRKIERDKRNAFIVKIVSSLVISIVWSALTIRDFLSEGDEATKKAWLNLLSRLSALVTSFVSGYSTAVVNVRDEANAIENKANILKTFKTSYDKQFFIAETYEEMVARELKEQEEASKENSTKEVVEISSQKPTEDLI